MAGGVPTSITLAVLSPASIVANGVTTSIATATVLDDLSAPLAGQTVTITSNNTQSITAVTDNGNGTYTATITSSLVAGTSTITATDAAVTGTKTATRTLTQTAGAAANVALSLSPTSILASGASTTVATATVTDANGNAKTAETVTFTASPSGVTIGTTTVVGNGTYTATITSSTTRGAVTITAHDGGLTHTAVLTLTLDVTGVAVALNPTTVLADGVSTTVATATVTDAGAHAVSGETITFTTNDAKNTIGAVTDHSDGTYTATITASTQTHSVTVTGHDVARSLTGTATLVQAGDYTTFDAVLNPTSIAADGASTTDVTVTIADITKTPISGQTVVITSNDSGQSIGAVTDNNDGTYTATITSSTTAAYVTVTATDGVWTKDVTLTQTLVPKSKVSEDSVNLWGNRDMVLTVQFDDDLHVTGGRNSVASPGIFYAGLTNGDDHHGAWALRFPVTGLNYAVSRNTNFYLRCQGGPGTGVFTLDTDLGPYQVTVTTHA